MGFLVFRRVTARYPEPTAALADAARTALLVAVPLLVFALVFRSNTRKVGSGWAAELMSFLDVKTAFGSSVVGCLFLGFLTVFCTLAVSVFWRRDWWGPRMQKAHEWLAAPLYGGATTLLLLPLAGLIGIGLLLLFGESNTEDLNDSDDWMAAVALAFSLLANGGLWLISLGAGASYGTNGEYRGEGEHESDSEMHHLKFFTEDEPGLWAAPVVALVVMLVSAFVVARKSAHPTHIVGNLLRWVGLLFVFIPLMLRLASVHAGFSSEGDDGDYEGSGFVGPDGVQTTFFLAGIGLVCAVIVAAISRAIDLNQIKAQLSAVGAKIQSTPAAPIAPPTAAALPAEAADNRSRRLPVPNQPPPTDPPPTGPPPWGQPPASRHRRAVRPATRVRRHAAPQADARPSKLADEGQDHGVLDALSPARRRFVLGLCALAALAVIAAVAAALIRREPAPRPVSQDALGPVLLVPGYGGATAALDVLAAALRAVGPRRHRRRAGGRRDRRPPRAGRGAGRRGAAGARADRSGVGRRGRATPPAVSSPGCGRATSAGPSPDGS